MAARRRIFRTEGYEKVVSTHRTIAEFTAARYLASSIREGIPIGRVIALVTGNDGGTLSDLRGLFAWLACLCPEHVESLIPRDPFGIVLYGDPAALSLSAKKLVIKSLVDLSLRNPWFRSAENWASRPLGGLTSQDMEPVFRKIIEDPTQHPVAVSCVLDAIRYGTPMPRLGDLLLNVVRDEKRRDYLRGYALKAFLHACRDRTDSLVQLLNDINSGHIKDDDKGLRGILLHVLYPAVIGVPKISDYLVTEHSNTYNDYNRFLDDYLIESTDPQKLPELLDAVIESGFLQTTEECFSCKRFVGNLLVLALTKHGDAISIDRLYAWFMMAADNQGTILIEKEDLKKIAEWFKSKPEIVVQLFFHLTAVVSPERIMHEEFRFSHILYGVRYPESFAQRVLEQAAAETNDQKAEFLFKFAVQFYYQTDRKDAPTVDELFLFVVQHTRFRSALESLLFCPLTAEHIKLNFHHIEHNRKQEAKRAALIEGLMTNIDQIRSGDNFSSLAILANIYFGLYSDIDRTLPPSDRLKAKTNTELTEAALKGFGNFGRKRPLHTPHQIGELYAQSGSHYTNGIVFLASMDVIDARSIEELLALPSDNLQSAVAYHYVSSTGGEQKWVSRLLAKQPALMAEALGGLWLPQFDNNVADIPGLRSLANDASMKEVAKILVPLLLRKYPACSEQHLGYLMRAAHRHVDHKLLIGIVDNILSRTGVVRGVKRVYWLALGYLLNSNKFKLKLVRYIKNDTKKAARLHDFITQIGSDDQPALVKDKPENLAFLISIIGNFFRLMWTIMMNWFVM